MSTLRPDVMHPQIGVFRDFERLYQTAPVGLCWLDRNLCFQNINEHLAAINGFSVEYHLGKCVPEVLPHLGDTVVPLLNELLETGREVVDLEITGATWYEPERERHFIVSYYPDRAGDDGILGISVVLQEITALKEAQAAVVTSEDRLRQIADALPAFIAFIDERRRYRFVNATYERAFGIPRQEFLGKPVEEMLQDGVCEAPTNNLERALQGVPVSYESYATFPVTGRRCLKRTIVPRWVDGEVRGVYALASDITDLKEAEETLRELSGRLISAQEKERHRIARDLHDDISQRLAVIGVELASSAQAEEVPEPERARLLDLEQRLQNISRDLHYIAYRLHPAKLEHAGLVRSIRGLCREFEDGHPLRISFTAHVSADQGFDPDTTLCLYRVLQESLRNATRHSGAETVRVAVDDACGDLRLVVDDDGIGFDAEKTHVGGLGLISMRERLRLLGGALEIASTPGEGTRILARVPWDRATATNT